ncbi:MAG TPA: hypothetical protein DCM05_09135 [Elusimicrobia bacterium]|nr:hypothetical protein [Elusimicrobiota bacterium]
MQRDEPDFKRQAFLEIERRRRGTPEAGKIDSAPAPRKLWMWLLLVLLGVIALWAMLKAGVI